jgi:periplasmic divalent cation tolerance protein
MGAILAITTLPDPESAVKIGKILVEARLAGCVHVLPAGQSIYRWQGKVELVNEATLLIKTSAARYEELAVTLRDHHPYDVPELIAFPIAHGLEAYLNWIDDETS